MNFVVTRSTWLRGTRSQLRNHAGHMCCLGFFACALQADPDRLIGMFSPSDVQQAVAWPEWLFDASREESSGHSVKACKLMTFNDEPATADLERERVITETFASVGVTVTFED